MNSASNYCLNGFFGQVPDWSGFLICIFSSQSIICQALPSNLQGSVSLRCPAPAIAFLLKVCRSLIMLKQNVSIYMQRMLEGLHIRISSHFIFFNYSFLSWLKTILFVMYRENHNLFYKRWNHRKIASDIYVSHMGLLCANSREGGTLRRNELSVVSLIGSTLKSFYIV